MAELAISAKITKVCIDSQGDLGDLCSIAILFLTVQRPQAMIA
jgi:hypothetical protein